MDDISGLNMEDQDETYTQELNDRIIALEEENRVLTQVLIRQGTSTTEAREFGVKAHLIAGTIVYSMRNRNLSLLEKVLENFQELNDNVPGFFEPMAMESTNVKRRRL